MPPYPAAPVVGVGPVALGTAPATMQAPVQPGKAHHVRLVDPIAVVVIVVAAPPARAPVALDSAVPVAVVAVVNDDDAWLGVCCCDCWCEMLLAVVRAPSTRFRDGWGEGTTASGT